MVVELSSEADLSTDPALSPITLGHTTSKEDREAGRGEDLPGGTVQPLGWAPWRRSSPTSAQEVPVTKDVPLYTLREGKAPAIKAAKPRVFIPAFPGTNCEVRYRPGL